MDRRETLKSLLAGSLIAPVALAGCVPGEETTSMTPPPREIGYGRTPDEKDHDLRIYNQDYFNESELTTLAILCDLILPATSDAPSAGDVKVVDFIEFIVKDIPAHQIPLRGGLMWLDHRSNQQFSKTFSTIEESQRKELLDEIAYPDRAPAHLAQGVKFFSLLRDLTLTAYYSSREGIKDLGYKGNSPNVWDGVPSEVLEEHGLSYEPEWLKKCIDQDTRMEIAQWDEKGNLIR